MANDINTEAICGATNVEGGRIVFSPEVIATIAGLATAEIEGVEGVFGGVADGIAGIFNNKKNATKGVKVEVTENNVIIDLTVSVKYGFKIHEVCLSAQKSIKNAVETMTGLNVSQVNIAVQSISFEKAKKEEKPIEIQPEQ